MQGRAVAIAGGASGLGLASAKLAAARGAEVALIDLDRPALDAAVTAIIGAGYHAIGIKGDVVSHESAQRAFDEAVAALGRIDSLINCAGIYPRVPILEITGGDWDRSFAVNVRGTYNMMVAAVNHMRPRRSGRIVNITSVDAFKPHPQNAHYAANKAAVVSLTKSFALAFAPDQILINSVAPAGMATERARASGFMAELVAANPLGRAAEPEEIAEMVLFLAGSRNTYATGENVIVSGGYVLA